MIVKIISMIFIMIMSNMIRIIMNTIFSFDMILIKIFILKISSLL